MCSQPLYESHPTHKPPKTRAHTTRLWGVGSGYTKLAVVIVLGKRPATFRTRKLSPTTPMVLHPTGCGRVGNRRNHTTKKVGGRAFGKKGTHTSVPHPTLHPPPPFHTHNNPEHTTHSPEPTTHPHNRGANPDYYCKDAQPHPTHTEHNPTHNTQTHQALQAPTPAKGTHGANREQHAHFFDDNERCTSPTGGG